MQPTQPTWQNYNQLGHLLLELEFHPLANTCFQAANQLHPHSSEIYINLGRSYLKIDQINQAITTFQTAAKLDPQNHIVAYNLGACYLQQHKLKLAQQQFDISLNHQPNYSPALNGLGLIQLETNQLQLAIDYFHLAIAQDPLSAHAHHNLAHAYLKTNSIDLALSFFQDSLLLKPDHTPSLNGLGVVYHQLLNLHQAQILFLQSLLTHPNQVDAAINYHFTLLKQSKIASAIKLLNSSLKHNPSSPTLIYHLFLLYNQTCNWSQAKKLKRQLFKTMSLNPSNNPIDPFNSLIIYSQPRQHARIAKAFSQNNTTNPSFTHHLKPFPRPTIGYLSSDLHDHATSHLLYQLFTSHRQLPTRTYSHGPITQDRYQRQIITGSSHFYNLFSYSNHQSAQLIHSHQIDILIDLKGHTSNNRQPILAAKPAPIQAHFLGFPSTTGADFIDYFITDPIASPPKHKTYFTEKLVFMPHSYQINSSTPFSSHPKTAFTFTCYNDTYKLQPQLFKLFCQLLHQLPHSNLTLLAKHQLIKKNLQSFASTHKIKPNRFNFTQKISRLNHLHRLSHTHLALDTIMVNGHTTTSDALLAGVPVVTVLGKHFASRVSASLLLALGLSECITHSLDDYYHLALSLAHSPHKLSRLKRKLIYAQTRYPLFDTKRFVKNLESAYTTIWSIYQAGEKPKSFHITDPQPLDNSYIK